jgi:putative spermidine/putrescine transport system ATP-binding protein
MVFQNYALFPHLTVFENVAFGLRLRKCRGRELTEKVRDALKLVHLESYEKKFPTQMSGGEQQRVAIARCIVLEPRLLLLDEPLSNLDAKLRVELRYELKALHERLRVTTVYVTHDQTEALALSDRVVVMRKGRIQQVGTPEEVYSDPANLFVADFMGYKNIWPARIESMKESAGGLELHVDALGLSLTARLNYGEKDPRSVALAAAYKNGTTVMTAIRPEDLQSETSSTNNIIRCSAALVEYQGQMSQVSAESAKGARLDLRLAKPVPVGAALELSVSPEKLLLLPPDEATT